MELRESSRPQSPRVAHSEDTWAVGLIVLITVLSSFAAYRPSHLYFYGDTWDILRRFVVNGWPEMWAPHNEHFIPVAKAVLYFQFLLFGMNNFGYQVVNIIIHAINAVLVYTLAGEITPLVTPRIFGSLFFALSGAFWEVTMWETGQQISLSLLFVLLALILFGRFLRAQDATLILYVFLSATCASLSMSFGLMVIPLLILAALASQKPRFGRRLSVASALAVATAILFTIVRAPHAGSVGHLVSLGRVWLLVPWTWTGLRDGLLVPSAASRFGPFTLACLFAATGAFFWKAFFGPARLRVLLVPLGLLLGPYAMAGVGRIESGIGWAASSRYQYLPAAGLALILVWIAAGIFEIAAKRLPAALFALAAVTMLTFPLYAIAGYGYVRQQSPRFSWGALAHRFVDLAIYQRNPAVTPAGMVCVDPELNLPASMYPFTYPLSRVLQLYAADGIFRDECATGILSVLGFPEIRSANLLGTRAGLNSGEWRSYGMAKGAGEDGAPDVVRIDLPGQGSAYSHDLLCRGTRQPYTFAAETRLLSGDPRASLRIIFKDAKGNFLDSVYSQPISSAQFEVRAVSGFAPPGTKTVGIDFSGMLDFAGPSAVAVKDVVLVKHPVYISASKQGEPSSLEASERPGLRPGAQVIKKSGK